MDKESLLIGVSSQKIERVVHFKVKESSVLIEAIQEAVELEDIHNGVIVSGLGALKEAVFRNLKWFSENFPVKPEDRLYLTVKKPLELVSLGGWITRRDDGTPEIHAHFSASTVYDDKVVTLGGHLTEGTIAGIKVVVAILVLEAGSSPAKFDESTKSFDIML